MNRNLVVSVLYTAGGQATTVTARDDHSEINNVQSPFSSCSLAVFSARKKETIRGPRRTRKHHLWSTHNGTVTKPHGGSAACSFPSRYVFIIALSRSLKMFAPQGASTYNSMVLSSMNIFNVIPP